jgi:serine protease Do
MYRQAPATLSLVALLLPVLAGAQAKEVREVALPSLAPLVESVKGAVVNVDVQARGESVLRRGEQEEWYEPFLRRRFGDQNEGLKRGSGSGFIVDPRGLMFTNNHVVEGAVKIRVRLDDGRAFEAEVLGRDPLTDLALLKLKGNVDKLPFVKLGDSTAMRVGDFTVAIGNPFGLASSVSLGIVSALDRNIQAGPYDQFLQTDAAINPGNSGGPLFNLKGEVIGINTAIVGGGTGIGFAVPSNVARALQPQLEKEGTVTRGWLGVAIQDFTPRLAKAMGLSVADGALVTGVNEGSPAARGGLKVDDVVTAVDGQHVGSSAQLSRTIALKRPESQVKLAVYRGGKPNEVTLTIGTRPDLENLGARRTGGKRTVSPEQRQSKLGIGFQDVDPRLAERGLPTSGALVVEVTPGSPADEAGLKPGMVIVEARGQAIKSRDDLSRALTAASSGDTVLLRSLSQGSSTRQLHALELP